MVVMIFDLKIRMFFLVQIFSFLRLHRKIMIIDVPFLLKGGPYWTFILWIFSNPLGAIAYKVCPECDRCLGDPFLRVFFHQKWIIKKSKHFLM